MIGDLVIWVVVGVLILVLFAAIDWALGYFWDEDMRRRDRKGGGNE